VLCLELLHYFRVVLCKAGWDLNLLAATHWIVVISVEQCLNGRSLQHQVVFLHLFGVIVVRFVCLSFVKVISVCGGLVGSFNLLVEETLPVVVLEPDVGLHFVGTVQTEAIAWFPL